MMRLRPRNLAIRAVIGGALLLLFLCATVLRVHVRSTIRLSHPDDSLWSAITDNAPIDTVRAILNAKPYLLKQDFEGTTALYWAAEAGRDDVIRELLERGADPNVQTDPHEGKLGETPIASAVRSRNAASVRLLIKYGARVDEKDIYGNNLIDSARLLNEPEIAQMLIDASITTRPVDRSK